MSYENIEIIIGVYLILLAMLTNVSTIGAWVFYRLIPGASGLILAFDGLLRVGILLS